MDGSDNSNAMTLWLVLVVLASPIRCVGADWPMYRGDATAVGSCAATTADCRSIPLWKHQAPLAPDPAWPRCPRMTFDRTFQAVAAGDRVLFGSSADGTVIALTASGGEVCWQFFTEGPIRLRRRSGGSSPGGQR